MRRYDLPERVIPREYLEAPAPPRAEAQRLLLLRAARSLGVGTAADLAGVLRPAPQGGPAGGGGPGRRKAPWSGWRWRAGGTRPSGTRRRRRPGGCEAAALLCPFDSLIWDRQRTERLFGFPTAPRSTRPAAKRVWGYYVFPFLLGERLVARVDLKADRERGVLVVPGAFLEAGRGARPVVAPALAAEVTAMAGWLGLEAVEVGSAATWPARCAGPSAAGGSARL